MGKVTDAVSVLIPAQGITVHGEKKLFCEMNGSYGGRDCAPPSGQFTGFSRWLLRTVPGLDSVLFVWIAVRGRAQIPPACFLRVRGGSQENGFMLH